MEGFSFKFLLLDRKTGIAFFFLAGFDFWFLEHYRIPCLMGHFVHFELLPLSLPTWVLWTYLLYLYIYVYVPYHGSVHIHLYYLPTLPALIFCTVQFCLVQFFFTATMGSKHLCTFRLVAVHLVAFLRHFWHTTSLPACLHRFGTFWHFLLYLLSLPVPVCSSVSLPPFAVIPTLQAA